MIMIGFRSIIYTNWLLVHSSSDGIRIWTVGFFFVEGGKLGDAVESPRRKNENQQQTQPTYDVRCWI